MRKGILGVALAGAFSAGLVFGAVGPADAIWNSTPTVQAAPGDAIWNVAPAGAKTTQASPAVVPDPVWNLAPGTTAQDPVWNAAPTDAA
ncbi:hypothetical protein [Streptomyces sp. SGAir0957]